MILKDFTTKSKSKKPIFIFILSLVVFFALRLQFLTKIPVFVDEAIYIRWSQIMRNEPSLRFLPSSDGKQPLFMWATMPSLKVFDDPLVAGRAVSIASGMFSLAGIALLTFVLTENLLLAGLSSLIYAVLPFSVFFDRVALTDSLLSAIGIWSLALGTWLVKKPRLDLAMILGFTIGCGLLTKSPATFFYIWQIILFVAFFDFKSPNLKKRIGKLLLFWLIVLVISQMMANILRLGTNFNMIGSRNQDYLFTMKEILSHPTNPLVGNLKNTFYWLWYLFTPALFVCILGSLFCKNKRQSIWIIVICLSALISQGLIAKVYTSRYIFFASIPLVVSASFGLNYFTILFRKFAPVVYFLFFIWPILLSSILVQNPIQANLPFDMRSGYLEDWTAGWGQKEVANYLHEKAKEGKKIIVGTDGYFGTLPDGLQIYTQENPNIIVIGGSPSIKTIPESLINSLKDKNNLVYLVANASRVNLSSEDLARFTLINRFDKPLRADGTRETLLFYELLK